MFKKSLVLACIVLAALAVGWSAAIVLGRAGQGDNPRSNAQLTATATEGTIEDRLDLDAQVQWREGRAQVLNRASGTITAALPVGATWVREGGVLYEVGLKPVFAMEGKVPSFRVIEYGTSGRDVAQVQEFLSLRGYYEGESTGTVDSATVAAIERWQRAVGDAATGAIQPDRITFLPVLPARVVGTSALKVGALVNGGEELVSILSPEPRISITVTTEQGETIEAGDRVTITHTIGDQTREWELAVGDARLTRKDGVVTLGLIGRPNVCVAGLCDELAKNLEESVRATIEVLPPTTGVTVPASALTSDALGRVSVKDEDGRTIAVKLLGVSRGVAVVSGIASGTRVQIGSER